MFEFMGCAIAVPLEQMSAIVRTESSAHPFAIGVVGGRLSRQPQSLVEAVTTVKLLRKGNSNYSVGMAQVNQVNFSASQLHEGNMFDPCTNLHAGSRILAACHARYGNWPKAYSCYYSGNPVTGYRHGYVGKVLQNGTKPILTSILTPRASDMPIQLIPHKKKKQGGKFTPGTIKSINKPLTLRQRRLKSSLSNSGTTNE